MILHPALPQMLVLPGFAEVARDLWRDLVTRFSTPDPPKVEPRKEVNEEPAAQEKAKTLAGESGTGRRATLLAGRNQQTGLGGGAGTGSYQQGANTLLGGRA